MYLRINVSQSLSNLIPAFAKTRKRLDVLLD